MGGNSKAGVGGNSFTFVFESSGLILLFFSTSSSSLGVPALQLSK